MQVFARHQFRCNEERGHPPGPVDLYVGQVALELRVDDCNSRAAMGMMMPMCHKHRKLQYRYGRCNPGCQRRHPPGACKQNLLAYSCLRCTSSPPAVLLTAHHLREPSGTRDAKWSGLAHVATCCLLESVLKGTTDAGSEPLNA